MKIVNFVLEQISNFLFWVSDSIYLSDDPDNPIG